METTTITACPITDQLKSPKKYNIKKLTATPIIIYVYCIQDISNVVRRPPGRPATRMLDPGNMFLIIAISLTFISVYVYTCKNNILICIFTSHELHDMCSEKAQVLQCARTVRRCAYGRAAQKAKKPEAPARRKGKQKSKTYKQTHRTADPCGRRQHLTMGCKGKCGNHTYTCRSSNREKQMRTKCATPKNKKKAQATLGNTPMVVLPRCLRSL